MWVNLFLHNIERATIYQFLSFCLFRRTFCLAGVSRATVTSRYYVDGWDRVALDASAICNVNFVGAVRGGPGCAIRKCVTTKSSVRLSGRTRRGGRAGGRRRDRNRRGALVVSIRRRIPTIRCYRMRNRSDSRLHTSAYPTVWRLEKCQSTYPSIIPIR